MQSKFQPHERQGYRPYRVLSKLAQHRLDAFVFMGDAVYADFPSFYSSGCCSTPPFPRCNPQCFMRGTIGSAGELDAQYKLLLDDEHFANFVEQVPSVFMWDDHELFDNYREGVGHVYYPTARAAFEKHLAGVFNPPPVRIGELYFLHRVPAPPREALAELFVLDGRSHRSKETILGEVQFDDLREWLQKPAAAPWRFIVTSTMVAEVAAGVGSDNWSLYIAEKRRLLASLFGSGVPLEGVVLLSGDAHFVALVEHRGTQGGSACRVWEVASSPLASVPLRPQREPEHYTGAERGFSERVVFLQSGANLYTTARLTPTTATVQYWRYKDSPSSSPGLGDEVLLHEVELRRGPLCEGAVDRFHHTREL